jgi:hypothetical protein
MSTFPILDVKTYWKNLSDWVTGVSSSKPKVMNINSSGTEIFTSANPATVQVSGSNLTEAQALPIKGKSSLSVLLNAVSIAAGASSEETSFGVTTEKELWVCVSIDKQPWTLTANTTEVSTISSLGLMLYPPMVNVAKTFSSGGGAFPAKSLYLGHSVSLDNYNLENLTSMTAAKLYQIPPNTNAKFKIINGHATDAATVTVKVIRVWR